MSHSTRVEDWIGTSEGFATNNGPIFAHRNPKFSRLEPRLITREKREEIERLTLTQGATFSHGSGSREIPEAPDQFRTCFERDRDRILHSSSFRRLAGKTQVFIFPSDHQRTRLTHALEVAQVAISIAKSVGLNVALTEAIALAHDCGHGPGGHPSEDAFSTFLENGYDHAQWGADHTLAPLNLCAETLDGVRNHSWSRPEPMTPEGSVVSFADRIAYCAHDLEDAIRSEIVETRQIPDIVKETAGLLRSDQLRYLIRNIVDTISTTGAIALSPVAGEVLKEIRNFNYHHIYMREESQIQAQFVVDILTQLVEYFIQFPETTSTGRTQYIEPFSDNAVVNAIAFTSGMTDKFAIQKAVDYLGYDASQLPWNSIG